MSEGFDLAGWHVLFPGDPDIYTGTYSVVDGEQVDDITQERIARVDASYVASDRTGYDWYANDGDSVVVLAELTDGSYAACMAWCDTTGWDCRAGAQWKWAPTRDDAIRFGLDRESRAALDLSIPEDAEGAVTS